MYSSPQRHSPAPPGGFWGVPRPEGMYNSRFKKLYLSRGNSFNLLIPPTSPGSAPGPPVGRALEGWAQPPSEGNPSQPLVSAISFFLRFKLFNSSSQAEPSARPLPALKKSQKSVSVLQNDWNGLRCLMSVQTSSPETCFTFLFGRKRRLFTLLKSKYRVQYNTRQGWQKKPKTSSSGSTESLFLLKAKTPSQSAAQTKEMENILTTLSFPTSFTHFFMCITNSSSKFLRLSWIQGFCSAFEQAQHLDERRIKRVTLL